MASLGAHLRELRQRRGLSLEEVARATKVALRYLEALEADAHADLPAPVFTRGFIRAYCQALGEQPDETLARYEARIAAPEPPTAPAPAVARPATPAPPASRASAEADRRNRGTVLVSFILLVVLGIALLAVALITRPGREERVGRAPTPSPPAATEPSTATPSLPAGSETQQPAPHAPAPPPTTAQEPVARPPGPAAPVAVGTPVAPAKPVLPAPLPPPAPAPPAAPPEPRAAAVASSTQGVSPPYRLVARVSEPTWIRVRTEDGSTSEETIPSGGVREWVSDRPFVVTIGNAGGVALELNGRALPGLGGHGVVVPRLVLPPDAR